MTTSPARSSTVEPKVKKQNSVRHTRAIQHDRIKRLTSTPPAEAGWWRG